MMNGSDISWSALGATLNLRTAAVIVHSGKVLLCSVDGLDHWFLPGGRVRFGEPAWLRMTPSGVGQRC